MDVMQILVTCVDGVVRSDCVGKSVSWKSVAGICAALRDTHTQLRDQLVANEACTAEEFDEHVERVSDTGQWRAETHETPN